MKLEFYGASNGNVTGSCHILRYAGKTVLFDCGLIQGGKKAEEHNKDPFPFKPSEIDLVILSHAHIDHSGRIPVLIKQGFKGDIFTHNATVELCEILLMDSAKLAEYDAIRKNKRNKKKGKTKEIQPLYTKEDAKESLSHFKGIDYDKWTDVLPGLKLRLQDAGHILGSAMVEVLITEGEVTKKLVFSGDVGQFDTPILQDPTFIEEADFVLMESTYGSRLHRERSETIKEIANVIKLAEEGHGNIIIPAFSVGRTQEILYHFVEHFHDWGLENWHIYLDSPMAIEASKLYWGLDYLHDNATKRLLGDHGDKIPLPNYKRSVTTEDSKALNKNKKGAIFIAGSGMCTGGRVLHHLRYNLYKKNAHIMIVGYQANGTLGRKLVDGATTVKMFGDTIEVNASIHTVGGLSAHADQHDLTKWVSRFTTNPKVLLIHGERESQLLLEKHLKEKVNIDSESPNIGDILDLVSGELIRNQQTRLG